MMSEKTTKPWSVMDTVVVLGILAALAFNVLLVWGIIAFIGWLGRN